MSQEVSPGDSGAEALRRPPRPFRMRGWYRALKRGEEWAIQAFKLRDAHPFQFHLVFAYGPIVDRTDFLYQKNPLLELFNGSEKGMEGKFLPVPLCYEDKSE